jgi:hypothetical protein
MRNQFLFPLMHSNPLLGRTHFQTRDEKRPKLCAYHGFTTFRFRRSDKCDPTPRNESLGQILVN